MINFLIINLITMIIINNIRINSFKKIIYFLIINLLLIVLISNSLAQSMEYLVLLICMLYIFVNCYTVRYSSIRIQILRDLNSGKKILNEEDLYYDRKKRLETKSSGFMRKKLFILLSFIVRKLKKLLI